MIYKNEKLVFDIPDMSSEWMFPAVLCYNSTKETFYVCENKKSKHNVICCFTIFHTILLDNHKFDITCRDFTVYDDVFKNLVNPILTTFCQEHIIHLNFDHIYE